MFQFYLSSIKSLQRVKDMESVIMFQFYLSSIKRDGRKIARPFGSSFQFYLSSIKSGLLLRRPVRPRLVSILP